MGYTRNGDNSPGDTHRELQGEPQRTEAEVRRLLDLATAHVRRFYGHHHQFEDILGAAHLGVAQKLAVYRSRPNGPTVEQVVIRGAHLAAVDWLRSSANEGRLHTRHGAILPGRVLLSAAGDDDPAQPLTPDFAPEANARVDMAAAALALIEQGEITALDWQICWRSAALGEKARALAEEYALPYAVVLARRRHCLAKLGAKLGFTERLTERLTDKGEGAFSASDTGPGERVRAL